MCGPGWAAGRVAGAIAPCVEGQGGHCGFRHPEDLAAVGDDGRWLLVSQDSASEPLVLLDTATGRRVAAALPAGITVPPRVTPLPGWRRPAAASRCPGPPGRIDAGGNDARRMSGQWVAAVLNRDAPARVELFAIVHDSSGAPQLHWRDCVPVPEALALNDVALGSRGELYVSHMFDPPRDPAAAAALRLRFLAAEPTGRALRWTAGTGWTPVAGTEVSFANGIAVSNDGRWLAVAGTFDQAVLLLRRGRDGRSHSSPRRVAPGLQPDNLTRHGGAGFVVAGHTGVPVTGVDPCRGLRDAPCGFPFAVSRIDAGSATATRLLDDEGRGTPGASVAVVTRAGLYLGSAFGDRVDFRPPGYGSHEPR